MTKPTLATALAVATLLVTAGPSAASMARADYCGDGAPNIIDGTSNTLQIGRAAGAAPGGERPA